MNPPDKNISQIENIPNFPERTVLPTIAEYAGDPEVGFSCELIFSTDSPITATLRMYQDEEHYVDWTVALADMSAALEGEYHQVAPHKDLNFWRGNGISSFPMIEGEITHDQGVLLQEPFRFALHPDVVRQFLAEVERSKQRAPLSEEAIIDMMTERAIAAMLHRG